MNNANNTDFSQTAPLQTDVRSELSSLSVRDLFFKYMRYLPLFVVSVAISLMAAYVYLRYAEPMYSTSGALVIKDEKSTGGKGDKFDELFTSNSASNIQTEMEILKSSPLMRRVVDQYSLSLSYYGIGKIKTVNVYKRAPFRIVPIKLKDSSASFSLSIQVLDENQLRVSGVNTSLTYGQTFTTPQGEFKLEKHLGGAAGNLYRVDYRPADAVASGLAGAIKVAPRVGGTGILNLSIQLNSPELCADVLNGLMDNYAAYSLEQKKLSSDQILKFADERLADIGRRLDSIQNVYLDYQIRYNIIDPESQIGAFSALIEDVDRTLNEQELQLGVVKMLDTYLADKKNDFSKIVVPSSMGLADPVLNALIGSYNQMQLQRQLMIDGNVSVENPSIRELDGQLEKVRLSIRESLRNIRSVIDQLVSNVKFRGKVGQGKLNDLPFRIKELAEIKRQVESYQALYKLFIEKKEETAISRASTVNNSSILDSAYTPGSPVSPNRRSIQLIALLVGLAIPAVFIFGLELFNDKIQSRFDIEKYTQVPILGEIGHSFSENSLVINRNNRSMVAEQFRIIRTNLQYFLHQKQSITILISSTFSGEGKSFASTNIGAAHALAGKKTILLEFDIRKPKVLSGLGMEKSPGITNFLVGKSNDLSALIRPVPETENLFVLPCGPVPPNPAEILLGPRVEELFNYVQTHFDVVVIDTAPVGMVSDGFTLGKFADCTIYMMRQNYSFKKQLALIDDYYLQKRLPQMSIVLNDVKAQSGYGNYGYGRYGYGYGYGYGYSSYFEEEKKPKSRIDSIKGWWKGLWG